MMRCHRATYCWVVIFKIGCVCYILCTNSSIVIAWFWEHSRELSLLTCIPPVPSRALFSYLWFTCEHVWTKYGGTCQSLIEQKMHDYFRHYWYFILSLVMKDLMTEHLIKADFGHLFTWSEASLFAFWEKDSKIQKWCVRFRRKILPAVEILCWLYPSQAAYADDHGYN